MARHLLLVALTIGTLASGRAYSVAPPTAPRVTVLVSADAPPYRKALEGFEDQLRQAVPAADIVVHQMVPGQDVPALISSVHGEAPRLLLALGSDAVEVARQVGDVPVVAGMVLRATDVLRGPQFTGVFLEFPRDVEFSYLARILPGQRRVAVLYNPAQNQGLIEEARREAKSSGLVLVPRKVMAPSEIPATLQSLTNNTDVLWGIADTLVLTPETARPILLFSLQNGIPFVGLSSPWVKAGALYALDRDYEDVGRQCADLARAILGGQSPAALPPVRPRKILYSINRHTAEKLKLTISRAVLLGAEEVIE